jgi:2'-5' RNA ligase
VTTAGRTALVVVTPEAEAVLTPWRRRHLRATVDRGIPAHITVLFPFVPAADVDTAVEEVLRELYAAVPPFDYDLASVESFPGYVWLAPRPGAPFHDLIARTRAAFPGYPPYGDPELVPVPHCTVGAADDLGGLAAIVAELRPAFAGELPIRCRARAVTLLEERSDETWSARASFRLTGTV